MTDPEAIAATLSEAQRAIASGRYDPEFASIDDAAELERLGFWKWGGPTDDDEFYHFDITPLGLAVRAILQGEWRA